MPAQVLPLAKTAIDDFIRQQLGINDPRDARAIEKALAARYPGEVQRIGGESAGYAGLVQSAGPANVGDGSPAQLELARARLEVAADLVLLCEDPNNRPYRDELLSLRDAIEYECGESEAAARNAGDPVQRSRAYLGGRSMARYARTARAIGALQFESHTAYRRLGRSCGRWLERLWYAIGEVMSGGGDGIGSLPQVPLTELRARADAIVDSLRRLRAPVGGGDEAADAMNVYQQLRLRLVSTGSHDLQAYLAAEITAQLLERLIALVSRAAADTRWAMTASGTIQLANLRRFYEVVAAVRGDLTDGGGKSTAAELLESSLYLFLAGFETTGAGSRAVEFAVPMALLARSEQGNDPGRTLLRDLLRWRADLVAQCDDSTDGDLSSESVATQVILDDILFAAECAIGIVADGSPSGIDDRHACALVIEAHINRDELKWEVAESEGLKAAWKRFGAVWSSKDKDTTWWTTLESPKPNVDPVMNQDFVKMIGRELQAERGQWCEFSRLVTMR